MSISKRSLLLVLIVLVAAAVMLSQLNTVNTAAMNAQPESVQHSRSAGYLELVFSDDFDGSGLDTNKWATCYWWNKNGCTNEGNNEEQWYEPANVVVSNGILSLTAQKGPVQGSNGKNYGFTSGMVTTGRMVDNPREAARYPFLYGYVEVRARMPRGKGLWPAIWMLPVDHTSKPEIDIMEILGDDPKTLHMNFHYADANGKTYRSDGGWVSDTDLTGDWHTFAVDWQPEAITWYVDGVKRREYTDAAHIPNRPMYLLMNLAVGGDWPGTPDANTKFPSAFEIDYARIWRSNSSLALQASADAYVDKDHLDQNFGKSPVLHVDGSPEGIVYLKFDLSGLSGQQVNSAVLRIRTTGEGDSGSENSQAVYPISDAWKEDTITFNNRPAINTYIIGLIDNTEPNVTYDIPLEASEVQKMTGKTLSLALVQTGFDGLTIYSREFRPFYPELILNTTVYAQSTPVVSPPTDIPAPTGQPTPGR